MKCTSCQQQPPIVECKDCQRKLCYQCDDKVHYNLLMSRHNRVTIPFRGTVFLIIPTEFQQTSYKSFTYQTEHDDTYQDRSYISPKSQIYSQISPKDVMLHSSKISNQVNRSQYQSVILDNRVGLESRVVTETRLTSDSRANTDTIECQKLKSLLEAEEKLFQKEKITLLQKLMLVREKQASAEDQEQIEEMVEILRDVESKFEDGDKIIEIRVQEVETLRDKYNAQLLKHKSQLTEVREKYESQVLSLEDKLVKASERIDELVNQQEEEDEEDDEVDELNVAQKQELTQIEIDNLNQVKKIIEQSGYRALEINNQVKKCDDLVLKVQQTTQLQTSQIVKMDEIIQMFKVYSDEMSKEKQLLLLDNEKLISEVEIFGKFFEENAGLLERIGQGPQEQEQD